MFVLARASLFFFVFQVRVVTFLGFWLSVPVQSIA